MALAPHAHLIRLLFAACGAGLPVPLPEDPPAVYLWWPSRSVERASAELVEAWGGVNAERGALPSDLQESVRAGRARVYLGHAPGRFPLYLERDQVAAARTAGGALGPRPGELFQLGSWSDLRDLAIEHGKRGPDGPLPFDFVSLGDELSFSPWGDPLEFAPTPAMQGSFDQWRRERGREPTPLERATWRRALGTGAPPELAAFVDRRRFEREWFTDRVGDLAGELRAAGLGDLGVLGIYGSPPFGGLTVDELVRGPKRPVIDVSEPYPEGLARRRVASAASPEHRWLTTLFLDASDPLRDPCIELWRTWAEGCSGYVVWNADRVHPPTERSQALLEELSALRALASAGAWEWDGPQHVALLVDDDQLAYEWLLEARRRPAEGPQRLGGWYEAHGRGPRLRRAWIAALESAGLQPGVLRPEALLHSPGFNDLIAVEQAWLGAPQAAAVEAHLRAGGHLWHRGALGTLDERGRHRATALTESWATAYPGRVHALEALQRGELAHAQRGEMERMLARAGTLPVELPVELPRGWWVRRGTRSLGGERYPVLCLFRAEPGSRARAFDAEAVERARTLGWTSLHGPRAGVWLLQGPALAR